MKKEEKQATELHIATGANLAECRDALEANNGDFEAAKKSLLLEKEMLYKDAIASLDALREERPEDAGALLVCTEGERCVMVKHGSTDKLTDALMAYYITDERFRTIIHAMFVKLAERIAS